MVAHYKMSIKPKPGKEGQKGATGFVTFKTAKADIEEVMKDKVFPNEDECVSDIELIFEGDDRELLLEIKKLFSRISGVAISGNEIIVDGHNLEWNVVKAILALTDTLEDQVKRLRELANCLTYWRWDPDKEGTVRCEEQIDR